MAYLKMKMKFPCGMEYEVIMRAFGSPRYNQKDLECPLHGKDCKTSQNVRKEKSK